ncbi:bifunctional SulP family inorganic anion transporter/carbonic anhydrase [Pontibacter sp. JH31]|uniref:Bifunctional SulP family inorganic anion transporter/carbonic anhydrase n=1 Tax=Pontibacter aquaedesilientis TaxID=2766980 RepID=A0ABR7XBW4_9BACT|nr:bifunctional SulP family inorganic anion transporter/carbonic anhydrase [Pontibacter aquaedesilientis]
MEDNISSVVGKSNVENLKRSIFSKPGKDIPAGIVVFLVALPLCLGIALASGAPLISGLISGIIGGIVIGAISQSDVSVSGPAASLTAVVLVAIQNLERFEIFLLALVLGGLIQLALGLMKAGLIADYLPTSIIKGLLAAIGLILIISQIPYAMGVELGKSRMMDYSQNFFTGAQQKVTFIFKSMAPGAITLSLISMGVLVFWDKTFMRKLKLVPPFLVVVILGVILNQFFKYVIPSLYLDGIHLVNIPKIEGFASFVTFPDFTAIGNIQVWTYAFTIALIASIASLLAIEAADNLDPHKRRSPPNRELVAQGIGNTLAGLVGGIPITSVIVRSSVNIETGAETKLSTIIHGTLLLVSVLFLSSVINLIPLASLAVLLLVVGYKLASVTIFKSMYLKGWPQFLPFVVTTLSILVTDVLIGVMIGTAVSIFFLLRGNFYNPFYIESTSTPKGKVYRLELSNEVSFLNKPAIKSTLWNLPKNSQIIIDATFATYIEPDVIEILHDFQDTFARENDIEVIMTGLRESYAAKNQEEVMDVNTEVTNVLATPQDILDYLKDGNQRYVDGNLVSRRLRNKELMDFIKEAPLAAVVNSIDMREPLNMLLNTGIGDLIPLRAAGNLMSDFLIYSTEIACRKQGARLILLMGNSGNSFISEALECYLAGKESYLYPLLGPALASRAISPEQLVKENLNKLVDEITLWNLAESKRRIMDQNQYIREQVSLGQLGLCSAFFDRETGNIEFSALVKV